MQLIIVTGLSGAGKSQAINCLEDLGYYCIDNMPPALINNFIELAGRGKTAIEKAALVVDVRGGEFFNDTKLFLEELKKQEQETEYKIIFPSVKISQHRNLFSKRQIRCSKDTDHKQDHRYRSQNPDSLLTA